MRFVKQAITDYTSAQVTETVPYWNSTTSYSVLDTVLYGNYIWKNSFANNLNNEPSDTSTKWVKWAVSNKYSLIDLRATTKTISATDMTVTFPRARIDTIIIGNYTAESILIELIDDLNNVLHSQTYTQSPNDLVTDYWTYIYSEYTIESDRAIYFDIMKLGTKIRITFAKGGFAQVEVGFIIGGESFNMGTTLENVKLGFTSYSKTNIDDFGIMKITKRAVQDIVDFDTIMPSEALMGIRRMAKQNRDEIVGFIVDEQKTSKYENIITLGVLQDIQPVASNFDKTVISWSILESI